MTDRYVTIIKKRRWGRQIDGIYPLPFKIIRETKASFEFEMTDALHEKLQELDSPFGWSLRKDEGIRCIKGGHRFDRERPRKYFVDKDTVLGITEAEVLCPNAAAFVQAVETYKARKEQQAVEASAVEKAYAAEADAARAAFDAAKAAIDVRKKRDLKVVDDAVEAAWKSIWAVQEGAAA